MSDRITEKDLDVLLHAINKLFGNSGELWQENPDTGKIESRIGYYYLDYGYGWVRLVRTMNEHGGIHVIIGYQTKRELYGSMRAFITGIEVGKSLSSIN